MKRYDQKYIKAKNQSRILRLLYEKGPKSRAQIAKEIGIVPSTVSDLTGYFLDHNILCEGRKIIGNVGRKPQLLYFNKDYYYFVSLVITSDEINLALCDLMGDIQREDSISYLENFSARAIIDLAFQRTDRILEGMDRDKIILISLGSPETVNLNTGEIKWAPYIQDWVGTDLALLFKKRYNVEVILKDHVKLETLGEQWKNYSYISNLVYITITRGIGSGVIIDGKLRQGKNGYLGEIAYLPVGKLVDFEELRQETKGLGHFESQCDIKHIEEVVQKYYKDRGSEWESIRIEEIAKRYQHDPELQKLINDQILENLALGIASVIIMFDPEIVIINGEIVQLGEGFLDILRKAIFNIIPYRTDIAYSRLLERSKVYGAIKHGLDYIEDALSLNPEKFYRTSHIAE